MVELNEYQKDAIEKLHNGSILDGGVGSGKSRTAIGYYMFKICQGAVKVNGEGTYREMIAPRDLYIITTAKKRDTHEWEVECGQFCIFTDQNNSHSGVKLTVDSWNNIKKYRGVYGAFFIFDEQRLVGSGAWVKSFYDIARKNKWILLSATPADQWCDYIPVFVANGFYKNKTEFNAKHCVFSRYSKYPKIDRYVGTKELEANSNKILVHLGDNRLTKRIHHMITVDHDQNLYKTVLVKRWNPYDDEPILECSKWYYLQRQVVNSDPSRIERLKEVLDEHQKCIIFYNYDYELSILRSFLDDEGFFYSEWNGHRHDELPEGSKWAYLVQYTAGCEGWNCITSDCIVFFSQNYSYRVLEQAMGRIDRVNTPYKELHYYHFRSNAYIDVQIYRSLKNKKKFNEDRRWFEKYQNDLA